MGGLITLSVEGMRTAEAAEAVDLDRRLPSFVSRSAEWTVAVAATQTRRGRKQMMQKLAGVPLQQTIIRLGSGRLLHLLPPAGPVSSRWVLAGTELSSVHPRPPPSPPSSPGGLMESGCSAGVPAVMTAVVYPLPWHNRII